MVDINLRNLKFEIINKETFESVLDKLKKNLYHSNVILPKENSEYRNLFKDIFTDLVNDIIQDLDIQNLLIYLITIVITPILDTYNKMYKIESRFMFRGGNILKMYKDKFEHNLSKESKDLIKKYFHQYFDFSDIDFMIYINNEGNSESLERKKHRDNIQALAHYSLSIVRNLVKYYTNLADTIGEWINDDLLNEVNDHKEQSDLESIINLSFTDIFFLDGDIDNNFNNLSTVTNSYLESYQKDHIIGYPDFASITENNFNKKTITPVTDSYELFKDKNLKKIIEDNYDPGIQYFYITDNNRLKIIQNNTFFRLSRLLVDFGLVYNDRSNNSNGILHTFGELYDLSIINKGDIMYNIYNDATTRDAKLRFKYLSNKYSFEIRIPKLKTSITDLMRILFLNRFPWADPKYEKRIYRLYLLLYIYSIKRDSKEFINNFLINAENFKDKEYKNLKIIDIKSVRRNYNYIKQFELSQTNEAKFKEFEKIIGEIESILLELNK